MATLTFHGAARQVTGSMHLLEAGGKLIVLDCGLFQGRRAETRELNRRFPVDPRSIHAVVVSHAHIDHIGRLPMLVRGGFDGTIHATPATRDLCAIMLADAAHIQEEDARYLNKRRKPNEPQVVPLYSADDVVLTLQRIQSSPYQRWFKAAHGVHVRFFEAGHMLGSAGIEIEINEENRGKIVLVFTGDVGRMGTPILQDPAPLPSCDYLICESTYGGRRTESVQDLREKLGDVVRRTVARGGRIIIPAFSVGRTQTIIYYLRGLFTSGRLDPVPVYIDSPLAINATDVFRLHPDCFDDEARRFVQNPGDILDGPGIHFVQTREESKKITRREDPCVVIAASGMCEAGRILHHLRHGVSDERNTIIIPGFQAAHTLGRRIVERRPELSIFGKTHELKAEVAVFNGFSSHADADELLRHARPIFGRCRKVFLVHGELDQSSALAAAMRSAGQPEVEIPSMGDAWPLD